MSETMRINKRMIRRLAFVASLLLAQVGLAQAPAGAPAGATGLCNDGTYYTGANKRGACRGHQGVKQWFGTPSDNGNTAPATGGTSQPSPNAPATSSPARSQAAAGGTAAAPAPGGGADKVWLNTASNVYHCPGTKYYGTTKAGTYMTEAEAKGQGARPDHGKPCK
jgi:hypothetical protein